MDPSDDEPLRLSAPWQAAWLLLGVPAACVFALGLIWLLQPTSYRYRDLTQDWLSARCYRAGLPIYTRHEVSAPKFLNEQEPFKIKVNAHPPVSVLFLLPLGWLEHDRANLVWNLVSLALIPITVWLVLGYWGLHTDFWCWLAALTLLICSSPLANQVKYAQFNSLLLLLLVAAWLADRRGYIVSAGCLVGVAAGLKLFPAFMLLYFLATRRWSGFFSGVLVMVLLHLVAIGVFGLDDILHYFQDVVPEVHAWRSDWLNCSLAGFWSRLFDVTDDQTHELWHAPGLAKLLTYLCAAAVALLAAVKCWRSDSLPQRDLAWSIVLVAMLLVSPVTWDHYLLLLFLPLAIGWYYARNTVVSRTILALVITVTGLFAPYVLWKWLFIRNTNLTTGFAVAEPWQSVAILSINTFALLLAFFWLSGLGGPGGDSQDSSEKVLA